MIPALTLFFIAHTMIAACSAVTENEQVVTPKQIVIARPSIFGGFSDDSDAAVLLRNGLQDHLKNLLMAEPGFAVLEGGLNIAPGMTIENITEAGGTMGAALVVLVELLSLTPGTAAQSGESDTGLPAWFDAVANLSVLDICTLTHVSSAHPALTAIALTTMVPPETGLYNALTEALAGRIHTLLLTLYP